MLGVIETANSDAFIMFMEAFWEISCKHEHNSLSISRLHKGRFSKSLNRYTKNMQSLSCWSSGYKGRRVDFQWLSSWKYRQIEKWGLMIAQGLLLLLKSQCVFTWDNFVNSTFTRVYKNGGCTPEWVARLLRKPNSIWIANTVLCNVAVKECSLKAII